MRRDKQGDVFPPRSSRYTLVNLSPCQSHFQARMGVAPQATIKGFDMRYRIAPLFCRPWPPNGMSPRLIESHHEHNYGAALSRLNAVTHELETTDIAMATPQMISRLKREQIDLLQRDVAPRTLPRESGRRRAGTSAKNFQRTHPRLRLGRPLAARIHRVVRGSSGRRGLDTTQLRAARWLPVVTFCVYGFHIGCQSAATLRNAGFDARYMVGVHYAWKALKGAVTLFDPHAVPGEGLTP